jgi:hypothetical protein
MMTVQAASTSAHSVRVPGSLFADQVRVLAEVCN